jgi:hypothetical protein
LDVENLDKYFGHQRNGLCFLKEKKFKDGELELIKDYASKKGFPFALTEESAENLGLTESKRLKAWKFEKVLPDTFLLPKRKENKLELLLDVLRKKKENDTDSVYKLRSLIKFSCAQKSDKSQLSLRLSKDLSPPIQINDGALLINSGLDPENFSDLIVKLVNLIPLPPELPKKPIPPAKTTSPLVVQEVENNNSHSVNSANPNVVLSAEVSAEPIAQVVTPLIPLIEPPEQTVVADIQSTPNPQTIVDVDYMNYSDQLVELNRQNYEEIGELLSLIEESDYIAMDFELTGIRIPGQTKTKSGFKNNLESAWYNSPVQIGLMGMKKDPVNPLWPYQIKNMKSVWKIPVALNGNTDRSIWQEDSLNYLLEHKFDEEKWKRTCIDHRNLIGLFKKISEKIIIVHNGFLDLLHREKLESLDGKIPEEILNLQDDASFSAYLLKKGIRFYDSRVGLYLLDPESMENLEQASTRILGDRINTELLKSFHDASWDAFCTGHLFQIISPLVEIKENVLFRMVNPPKKPQRRINEKQSQHLLPLSPEPAEFSGLSASSVEFRPNYTPFNGYPYDPSQYFNYPNFNDDPSYNNYTHNNYPPSYSNYPPPYNNYAYRPYPQFQPHFPY